MRALSVINYPSLLNLPRRQYDEVRDALAPTPKLAKAAACGHRDESVVRRSVQIPVKNLIEPVGVRPEDDVLEFWLRRSANRNGTRDRLPLLDRGGSVVEDAGHCRLRCVTTSGWSNCSRFH